MLQISLKDFRRLCILKGIFPRDPKKKVKGKDKTYYHVKDIKFLAHEPLLNKFRELKTFLKKYKNAIGRKDKTRAQSLLETKPQLILDHLVKERYPSFQDALRDLDDALSMIHLFAVLPAGANTAHNADRAALCRRLVAEWHTYVVRTNSLRKAFISIKGYYFQAEVQGQAINWLVPHRFTMVTPKDVDYRVMLTFLQFYTTLLRFVHFRLFNELGLHYPPKLDETNGEGLESVRFETLEQHAQAAQLAEGKQGEASTDVKQARALQKAVDKVVKRLGESAEGQQEGSIEGEKQAQDDAAAGDDFAELAGSEGLSEAEKERLSIRRLFAGLKFGLNREVPFEPFEFVIRAAGGAVVRESLEQPQLLQDSSITHHLIDRPTVPNRIAQREYIQPQWVVDAFNVRALLPATPYAPGTPAPPHLSPFVDDEKEGYVPKQRLLLQQWAGQLDQPAETAETAAKNKKKGTTDSDEPDEQQFQKELAKETAGVSFSESKEQDSDAEGDDDDEDDEEEEEVEAGEDDDEEEEENGEDEEPGKSMADENDDDEDDEDSGLDDQIEGRSLLQTAAEETKGQKKGLKRKSADDGDEERQLALMMMSHKKRKIYDKIQGKQQRKVNAAERLMEKRRKIEKEEKKQQKPASQKRVEVDEEVEVQAAPQPKGKQQGKGSNRTEKGSATPAKPTAAAGRSFKQQQQLQSARRHK